MLRTCPVKFPAMKFTLSVRSFQVRDALHLRLSAELAFRQPRRRASLPARTGSTGPPWCYVVFELENLSFYVDKLIFFDRSPLAARLS